MTVTFSIFNTSTNEFVGEGVNFSNSNASLVLGTLGLPTEFDELAGERPAQDFLGRVLLAIGLAPADEGCEARELTAAEKASAEGGALELFGNATVIDCGRRPGYLQERLGELRELAEQAIAGGHDLISWA